MTISDQLHFSVLTAPVATLDRRVLSQAWYSALYAVQSPRAATPSGKASSSKSGVASRAEGTAAHARCAHLNLGGIARVARQPLDAVMPAERRAERCALARRIERAFLRPAARPSSANFTLEGGTRVRVIWTLYTRGKS